MISRLVPYEILWRFGMLWDGVFFAGNANVFFPSSNVAGKIWSEGRNEGGDAGEQVAEGSWGH